MTANTPSLIDTPIPASTPQAEAIISQQQGDIRFSPVDAAFLKLFGQTDLFGGIAPALSEAVDALKAAHQVYGLQRYDEWANGGARFGRRIDELEASGSPDLGLPSTEEENPTPGDMLSRLEDHALEADELLRVKALLGARIAKALSKGEPLPRSAVAAHESLLICHRNRSRQHEDWRTVSGHAEIDEAGLRALKVNLKSTVARDFIDDSLIALASAVADPNAAPVSAAGAGGKAESAAEPEGDDEDPTELAYGQPADISIAGSPETESMPSAPSGQGQLAPDGLPAEKKISLIGWRIVDGLYAPFTHKLGVTTAWGASPLADHTVVCRALKHDFVVGDIEVKNKVCVAYDSQQTSLPPQLALTIPLKDTGGLFYDVVEGCFWVPYAHVLGKDDPSGKTSSKDTPRYGRMRIYTDPDLAQHRREQHQRLPDAKDMGDLLYAGALPEERVKFLKRFRAYLRSKGDSVHPQYAGRHARSLGPAIKELTGSDVLAMFLALDGSMSASGMLHYVTLSERFVHAQQQRVLAHLGWKPPPDLDPNDDGVLGADNAIPLKDYIAGWKGVQAAAAEALAALDHASCLAEIESAWGDLARARLLSFGCISGHRLTRIARLTGQAVFGHDRYICVSDKVTSHYDAYRLLPVTVRIAQLRACLLSDIDALHAAIARNTPEALNDAVVQGARSKVVFFGLKVVVRNGKERLKRTSLDLKKVEALSQTHFKREANIGRHQLVSGMVEAGVDHWLIRALTGHHNLNAEVFGDASAVAPRHFLEQLRSALDSLLADSAFAPFPAPTDLGWRIAFKREVATPPLLGDAYVYPRRGIGGRLLPPLADRHTLLALTTTDEVRNRLLTPEEARDPWIDLLLCFVVFDGLHHEDIAEIWKLLPSALVSVAATCAAAWTRGGRSNLLVVPLSPPTLAALARVACQPAPAWSAVTAAAGGWLKTAVADVTWPKEQPEGFLAFIAMAGRWLRLHLNPATYAASLRCVMSSALSAHSILRLATADAPELPVDVLSKQRALRPGNVRLRTGSLRQGIRAIGTVLFRYGGTKKRHGEDEARARKATADLTDDQLTSKDLDADDHLRNEKAAEAVLGALVGHQPAEDLPALAALAVVRKEANLILDRHKDRRSWGGIATYWTEVALALELVSPSDDMRQWAGADFEAWVELAVASIALDARKKGKKGDIELDGLRRFLKVGRLLGWEVPPGLIDPKDIYRQDGMRQSSAATLLRIEDFQAARPLVRHALRDWPLAQKRADLLLDLLIEVPARTGELDTAFARCVTAVSRMLCVQPAGFSALKNSLAVRLIALSEALADRLLNFDGEEIDGLGEFLFLDEDGDDWTMLKVIRDAIHQALLLVTGDVNLRFHAARGSAACRIAFPQWEAWAKSLLSGTTGARFGDTAPHAIRESVAQAISALGHGRVPTFLGYYYSVWPWVRAHELRLTLGGVAVPIAFEKLLFETTEARRAAKSRAERAGQRFDHWDWIGRQMAARLAAPALESGQAPPVLTPEDGIGSAAPALAALTRYGLWTLAGVPGATAGHHCGVGALFAASMDDAIARLAPSFEAVWERRGQPRGQRGADTDLDLARGEVGDAFSDHFSGLSVAALSLLSDCLAVDRRRLLLLPDAVAAQNKLVQQLAKCMPTGLAKLLVREPLTGGFEVDLALVLELVAQLAIGTKERDIGRHCLFQVVPADDADNRKRTGPITGLTRATCIAALASHQVLKGLN